MGSLEKEIKEVNDAFGNLKEAIKSAFLSDLNRVRKFLKTSNMKTLRRITRIVAIVTMIIGMFYMSDGDMLKSNNYLLIAIISLITSKEIDNEKKNINK